MSKTKPTSAEQVALNYIELFKQGKSYSPPPIGLVAKGELDSGALKIFNKFLLSEEGDVRENIVSLIADAAIRADSLYSSGVAVLRQKPVLNALVKSGLVKPDAGRERAADVLRNYASAKDLAPFAQNILLALTVQTSDEMLLLTAKVKPLGSSKLIEAISTDQYWKNNVSLRIAQAALGNEFAFNELLDSLHRAIEDNNAESFATAIDELGKTGTPSALREVALQLRTPLFAEIPGVFRKSSRLDVLLALIYNFPDNALLNPNNIRSDADYAAAEKFCQKQLKIDYGKPRPPFLTYQGYGHPK